MAKKHSKKANKASVNASAANYQHELERLQVELAHLQSWVVRTGARVVVVFEGRDAAGKGGMIKRITERVSPRVFRVVALPVHLGEGSFAQSAHADYDEREVGSTQLRMKA